MLQTQKNEQGEYSQHSPTIYKKHMFSALQKLPVLPKGQNYIYVMLSMPQGNIKIGKTTNIAKRLKSLSGSNGAGNEVVALYCSPATYLCTLEKTCHTHYDFARIPNTEWFRGDKVNFKEVVEYVDGLFRSESYERCNELRKRIYKEKKDK